MPTEKTCSNCGTKHASPRGRKCQLPAKEADSTLQSVITKLEQISAQMFDMNNRLELIENQDANDGASSSASSVAAEGAAANPSSLRADLGLQTRIDARMRDLKLQDAESDDDDHGRPRGKHNRMKSGRDKTSAECVSTQIEWPHYYVFRGSDRRPARYDELSVPEFVAGYMKIVTDNVADVHTTTLMLNHLHDLMSDVTEHSWDNVRNCHAIILQQMEQGRITWEDERRLRELRHTYAHARARGSGEQSKQNLRGPVFCYKFQDGECPYDHDHTTSRGFVRHICAYCLKHTGFAYKHPWSACQRKQRDQSKNGEQ